MEQIPQGAIWVKNARLRQSISNYISTRNLECPSCHNRFQQDLNEIEQNDLQDAIVNHVMTVKVKTLREKFIAVFNPKKNLSTHPDYYLYVYQAYTGAATVSPFASSRPIQSDGKDSVPKQVSETSTPNPSFTTDSKE